MGAVPRTAWARACTWAWVLGLSGCSACSSSTNGGSTDLASAGRLYFVAEDGDDGATGTREQPFRTLARALEASDVAQVFVSAGRYAEAELQVRRPVELIGPGARQAKLEGKVKITAPGVSWSGIDVEGSLRAERAAELVVKDTRVSPVGVVDAVVLEDCTGDVQDLQVTCGLETCLRVEGSTLSFARLELAPIEGQRPARVMRVTSSSVSVSGISSRGGTNTQVQAERNSTLTIRGGTLGAGSGTQLSSGSGARVAAFDLQIPEPGQLGALAARGTLRLVRAKVGSSNNICTGTQGGRLELIDSEIGACAVGSVTAANFNEVRASVYIRGGVIRHGRFLGVNLSQGRVEVEGTRFEGVPDFAGEGDEALLAASDLAELVVRGAVIEHSTGNAIGLHGGARADLRVVVRSPRLSGIMVGSSPGTQVVVRGSEISGCRGGSGLVIFDSTGVRVETTVVTACLEAGLIAGDASEVSVENATFEDNQQYGIAAFGQSTVTVSNSASRGSPWAVYASCGDGSRVEDAGANRFEGPTTDCF